MLLYKVFYLCSLGICVIGILCILGIYCYDFFHFLNEKTTNKYLYEDWMLAGKMLIGTGIFVGIFGFILSRM